MRVVIQLIADDMSVAEFGDEQQTTSTSAESNVDEYAEVLPRYNRTRHRVTDGKFCGNARPQFRVLVALGNCTVGIVDSLGPLTEGFYDTALNEGYCPNSVLLPTGGLDREKPPLTIGGYE